MQEPALMKTSFALSNKMMYDACWDREVLLVKRNIFLYGFRTMQTIILAVACCLTFPKLRMPAQTQADGDKFISVLFFSLMICMFDGVTELNLTVRMCMHACVRVCVCVWLCVVGCARAYVRVRFSVSACMHACVLLRMHV